METPTTQGVGGIVTKSYWVKPDALPATGSVQDILGAKASASRRTPR